MRHLLRTAAAGGEGVAGVHLHVGLRGARGERRAGLHRGLRRVRGLRQRGGVRGLRGGPRRLQLDHVQSSGGQTGRGLRRAASREGSDRAVGIRQVGLHQLKSALLLFSSKHKNLFAIIKTSQTYTY